MILTNGKISLYDLAKEYTLKKPFNFEELTLNNSEILNGKISFGNFYGKSNNIIEEALIYEKADNISFEIANRRPQTLLDVFNSWGRFDGEKYYDNKLVATGNASAWLWDSTTSSVVMPLNVSPANGFVSNLEYDNYDFSATVSSNSSDDDTIGLVAAFNRGSSNNYFISFIATNGGANPTTGIGVYLNYVTSPTSKPLWTGTIETNKNSAGTGWSNRMIRLRIVRNNDTLTFYHSPMNSEVLSNTPAFTLDLNSDPDLYQFKGKKKYGYITYSQPNSTYKNIVFNGGVDNSKLLDIINDTTWNFDTISQTWINSNKSLSDSFGYNKIIINPEGENNNFIAFLLTKDTLIKLGNFKELTDITLRSSDNIIVTSKSKNISQITGNSIVSIYKETGEFFNIIDSPIPIISKTNNITINKVNLEYTVSNSIIITDTNEIFYIETDHNETELIVYSIDSCINIYTPLEEIIT